MLFWKYGYDAHLPVTWGTIGDGSGIDISNFSIMSDASDNFIDTAAAMFVFPENNKEVFHLSPLSDDNIIFFHAQPKKKDLFLKNWLSTESKSITTNKEKFLICFDSKSLGDNIAWMPYAEEFRKKHDCKVVLSTFWNDLFEKEYPDIEFIGRGEVVHNINGQHNIGWYQPWNPKLNPNDFRTIPLQQTATDILGLDYREIKPKITIPDKPRTIEEKYVCIGMHSTCQSKYWNYPDGWQKITD